MDIIIIMLNEMSIVEFFVIWIAGSSLVGYIAMKIMARFMRK